MSKHLSEGLRLFLDSRSIPVSFELELGRARTASPILKAHRLSELSDAAVNRLVSPASRICCNQRDSRWDFGSQLVWWPL